LATPQREPTTPKDHYSSEESVGEEDGELGVTIATSPFTKEDQLSYVAAYDEEHPSDGDYDEQPDPSDDEFIDDGPVREPYQEEDEEESEDDAESHASDPEVEILKAQIVAQKAQLNVLKLKKKLQKTDEVVVDADAMDVG